MQTKARSKAVGQVLLIEQKAESKGRSEKKVRKVAKEHIVVCGRQPEMLTGERA